MKRQEGIDTIRAFVSLRGNWDSYGADPVTQAAVDAALAFLNLLPDAILPSIFVGPRNNGGVCFEDCGLFLGKAVPFIAGITPEGKLDGFLVGTCEVEFVE